jgi:hypothetical protein
MLIFACDLNQTAPSQEDISSTETIDFTRKEINIEGEWFLYRIDIRNCDWTPQTMTKTEPLLRTQYDGDSCIIQFTNDNKILYDNLEQGLWTSQAKRLYVKKHDNKSYFPIPLDMSYGILLKSNFLLELESKFQVENEVKIGIKYYFRRSTGFDRENHHVP